MEFNKLLCVSFTLVPIIDLNSFLFHFHCILLFPLPEFCFFGDLNTLDNSETLHTQFQWPWIGFQFLCFISFWLQQNCRTLSYVEWHCGENDFPLFMVKLLQHPTSQGGWLCWMTLRREWFSTLHGQTFTTPHLPGGLVLHYRYQKLTCSLWSKLDIDHLYIFKYYQAHPISCATCPRLGACCSVTTKGKTKPIYSMWSKLDLDHLYMFKYYLAHPISCATCPRLGACWSVTTKVKTKPIYSMVVTVPICVPSFLFPGDVALIIGQPKKIHVHLDA